MRSIIHHPARSSLAARRARNAVRAAIGILLLCVGAAQGAQADPPRDRAGADRPATKAVAPPMRADNPLRNLPSAPGATIPEIDALAPNGWLNLGSPAADPLCGRAHGRSYGAHAMVAAPAWRGALFTGEGRHGFVKADGYGMDDWWFYDINAHAWICLFRGTDTRALDEQVRQGEILVDDLGRAVDRTGQPIPAHLLIHAYHLITYVPEEEKFYAVVQRMPYRRYYMPGLTGESGPVHEGLRLLREQGLEREMGRFGPWTYDLNTGRFALEPATGGSDMRGPSFPFAQYVASKRRIIRIDRAEVRYYDPARRTWSPPLPSQADAIEFSGCYDPRRDTLYFGGNDGRLWRYDVSEDLMHEVAPPGDFSLSVSRAGMYFDSRNDVVLVIDFHTTQRIYSLDPRSLRFGDSLPIDAALAARLRRPSQTASAFYDPRLGVVFVFTARDSSDDGQMWVYRPPGGPEALPDR